MQGPKKIREKLFAILCSQPNWMAGCLAARMPESLQPVVVFYVHVHICNCCQSTVGWQTWPIWYCCWCCWYWKPTKTDVYYLLAALGPFLVHVPGKGHKLLNFNKFLYNANLLSCRLMSPVRIQFLGSFASWAQIEQLGLLCQHLASTWPSGNALGQLLPPFYGCQLRLPRPSPCDYFDSNNHIINGKLWAPEQHTAFKFCLLFKVDSF